MSKFKNSNGVFLLKGLFFEQTLLDNRHQAIYTLKDEDHEGLPSLYRLYMELEDPTEWEFSQKYLDGWEHWCALCKCKWFKEYIDRWREELELKFSARAFKNMVAIAKTNGREAAAANKYLLDKGWFKPGKEDGKRKVGRPSKELVEKEIKRQAREDLDLAEDLDRIGITIN